MLHVEVVTHLVRDDDDGRARRPRAGVGLVDAGIVPVVAANLSEVRYTNGATFHVQVCEQLHVVHGKVGAVGDGVRPGRAASPPRPVPTPPPPPTPPPTPPPPTTTTTTKPAIKYGFSTQ